MESGVSLPPCLQYTQDVDTFLAERAQSAYVKWCKGTGRTMTPAKRDKYILQTYTLMLLFKDRRQQEQKGETA